MVVLFLTATSGDALLFKRGRGGHSGWSKGKNLGRDKVSSYGSPFESWVTRLTIESFSSYELPMLQGKIFHLEHAIKS